MTEFIVLIKAYLLLTTAVIGGESLANAGPDYVEATCYIEGYDAQTCAYIRSEGILQGAFPMDLTEDLTE